MTSTYLFISYSRENADIMRRLRTRLEESGISCWTDENLKPGTPDWQIAIEQALDGAAGLIALWTPGAKESRWMREELRYASARDLPIIPVLMEGDIKDAVPFGFSGMQFIDLRGSENLRLNFRDLLASVEELAAMPSRPTLIQTTSRASVFPTRAVLGGGAILVVVMVVLAIRLFTNKELAPAEIGSTEVDRASTQEVATAMPEPTSNQPPPSPPDVVSSNADWQPRSAVINGVEMMLVPPGCFTMGANDGRSDERPTREICFGDPFWIDRFEVTNVAYGSIGLISGDAKPRESVNWFDAVGHCEQRGARLPSEAEWEYAARGPDGNNYPWGDGFDSTLLNYCDANCSESWADANADDGFRTTAFVGSYEEGASWVGAEDMAGNVWEWINAIYRGYPYDSTDGREAGADADSVNSRVARGGSWVNVAASARSAIRLSVHPLNENPDLGFRCAADY